MEIREKIIGFPVCQNHWFDKIVSGKCGMCGGELLAGLENIPPQKLGEMLETRTEVEVCKECGGTGEIQFEVQNAAGDDMEQYEKPCLTCNPPKGEIDMTGATEGDR